jgi:hypothetical protein
MSRNIPKIEERAMNLTEKKAKQTSLTIYAAVVLGAILLAGTCAPGGFAQASSQTDHAPSGWFLAGNKPANYRTGVDQQMLYEARPSAYLVSTVQDTGGFGTLMQSITATQYAGKRVRLRAWVQSKDVADWAGLWMRVDKGQAAVGFDNMQQRAIRGTSSWTTCDVVLDVPADATGISFGTLLSGSGEVWLNDVKFDVVGQDVPVTGTGAGNQPATPVNLDFQK